jgi:hypothetical protein
MHFIHLLNCASAMELRASLLQNANAIVAHLLSAVVFSCAEVLLLNSVGVGTHEPLL